MSGRREYDSDFRRVVCHQIVIEKKEGGIVDFALITRGWF